MKAHDSHGRSSFCFSSLHAIGFTKNVDWLAPDEETIRHIVMYMLYAAAKTLHPCEKCTNLPERLVT